jgi:hypothetical protein
MAFCGDVLQLASPKLQLVFRTAALAADAHAQDLAGGRGLGSGHRCFALDFRTASVW